LEERFAVLLILLKEEMADDEGWEESCFGESRGPALVFKSDDANWT
jgi:hypothetical protein